MTFRLNILDIPVTDGPLDTTRTFCRLHLVKALKQLFTGSALNIYRIEGNEEKKKYYIFVRHPKTGTIYVAEQAR